MTNFSLKVYDILTLVNNKTSLDELVKIFLKRGGRINKFYLQSWNKNKHAVVYLKGWFGGKNIREALINALS